MAGIATASRLIQQRHIAVRRRGKGQIAGKHFLNSNAAIYMDAASAYFDAIAKQYLIKHPEVTLGKILQ